MITGEDLIDMPRIQDIVNNIDYVIIGCVLIVVILTNTVLTPQKIYNAAPI